MSNLTQEQLATLKQALQHRYRELLDEIREELIRSGDQHYIDLAGRVPDPGDQSVAYALADLHAVIVDRQIKELRIVEAALERMAQMNYGDCVECGADIGFERLTASPTAARCIGCQAVYEKTHAGPSSPSL